MIVCADVPIDDPVSAAHPLLSGVMCFYRQTLVEGGRGGDCSVSPASLLSPLYIMCSPCDGWQCGARTGDLEVKSGDDAGPRDVQ